MKIFVEWKRPMLMKDGLQEGLIYSIDLDKITSSPGVYVFGRRHGKKIEALYVGKADNIRKRVEQQLNHLRLMKHLNDARTGKRILLIGTANIKRGQKSDKVISVIEKSLIRHFVSEGHDLVNKKGVAIREHEIESDGYQPKKFIPRQMFLEKESSPASMW